MSHLTNSRQCRLLNSNAQGEVLSGTDPIPIIGYENYDTTRKGCTVSSGEMEIGEGQVN